MRTIRNANSNDIPSLSRLYRELQALHVENAPHLFQYYTDADWELWFARNMDEVFASPREVILFAEVDSTPAGFAHLILRNNPPSPIFVPRQLCMVEEIIVAQSHQRIGIGQALMQAAEDWEREHGAASLELSDHDFNVQAISYYCKLGFVAYTHKIALRFN